MFYSTRKKIIFFGIHFTIGWFGLFIEVTWWCNSLLIITRNSVLVQGCSGEGGRGTFLFSASTGTNELPRGGLILCRAQLFEGRLALNPGLNLARVSFSFVPKHFLGQFSLIFIEHRIINLLTKIIKLNLLFKLSYLNSSFVLTPGYLNPALNNPAQDNAWAPRPS